jgi:hypothetical protein
VTKRRAPAVSTETRSVPTSVWNQKTSAWLTNPAANMVSAHVILTDRGRAAVPAGASAESPAVLSMLSMKCQSFVCDKRRLCPEPDRSQFW